MDFVLPAYGRYRNPATGQKEPAYASPAQAAFHEARAPFKLFNGGVGSGKSHAGAREFLLSALDNGPDQMYLVGAPTHAILEDATWKHITMLLDDIHHETGVRLDKKRLISNQKREITLYGDIKIRFISLQKPENYAGATISGFWIDEGALLPDGRGAWDMLMDRLRDSNARRQFGLVTTSPRGPVGVVQHFLNQTEAHNPDYHVTHSTTWDNIYNGPDYIRRMMVGRSKRQVRQQLYAQILDFQGGVYSGEFSRTKSVFHDWQQAKGRDRTDVQYHVAIDWGPTYPHVLFIEYDWKNDYDVIFDEICQDNMQHEEVIIETIRRLGKWGLSPGDLTNVWCDYNPQAAVRYAYKHFRHGHGVRVRAKVVATTDDLRDGIDAVAARLRDADGKRRLYFTPDMAERKEDRAMFRCMGLYRWAERNVQSSRVMDDRRPEKGLYDHGPDAYRYRAWQGFGNSRWKVKEMDESEKRRKKAA